MAAMACKTMADMPQIRVLAGEPLNSKLVDICTSHFSERNHHFIPHSDRPNVLCPSSVEDASVSFAKPQQDGNADEPREFLEQPQPPILVNRSHNTITVSWKPSCIVGALEGLDQDVLNASLQYQLEYLLLKVGTLAYHEAQFNLKFIFTF